MSYTQFSKPYVNGWQNNESGATPITAEILNTNYDAYLLGLNTWAGEVNLALAGIPTKVSDLSNDLHFSAVSFTQIQSTGTKIGTITVDGVSTDIYAPSGGSGGDTVTWTQIVSTGTKIATIDIDGVSTDVYAPTSGGATAFASLSDVDISNPSNGQVPVYNGTTSKWENETLNVGDKVSFTQIQSTGTKIGTITINNVDTDIYAPNGGGGGTTVVANPSGPATADLEKLQVGNDIYAIPSGGGSGLYSGKTYSLKTKTWTGNGESTNAITVTEKPDYVLSIYGPGLNGTSVLSAGFPWGDTNSTFAAYMVTQNGILYDGLAYSNNDMTLTITGIDAGAVFNASGQSYTMYYLVKQSLNEFKDVTGTLAAGSTSITLSDSSITTSSTIEVFDSLDVPYNTKTLSTGSITLTFDAQQTAMDVKVRVS